MGERLNYRDLLDLAARMVRAGESGTLFVRTDNNHSVIIGIQGGAIVSLSCGLKHGTAAIPMIRQMSEGSYRLDPGVVAYHADELPDTGVLLDLLAGEEKAPPASSAPERPEPTAAAPEPASGRVQGPPAARAGGFDQRLAISTLCDLLRDYLGPIGPTVCQDTTQDLGGLRSGRDLELLIGRLREEIDEPEEAVEFANRARERLKGLLD
jgi:hypothetical protein